MHEKFGRYIEQKLTSFPFGSIGKRELELILLKGILDAGLCESDPVSVAQKFGLTLSKAHSYLTDIALREQILSDAQALKLLSELLESSEVRVSAEEILIPLPGADLRIWLERKLAYAKMIQGETLRRDLIKISPKALFHVLDLCKGQITPKKALKLLKQQMPDATWLKDAEDQWTEQSKWSDVVIPLATQAVAPILQAILSMPCAL